MIVKVIAKSNALCGAGMHFHGVKAQLLIQFVKNPILQKQKPKIMIKTQQN